MRHTKAAFQLSDSLHHRLNMYALAASAAGVGVLALAHPAQAKIVYTRTHRIIGPGQDYDLDLNHDKITDFRLANVSCPDSCAEILFLSAAAGNSAIGSNGWCAAMKAGSLIGPSGPFHPQSCGLAVVGEYTGQGSGPWYDVTKRYLGLRFEIKGKQHYGWARLNTAGRAGTITLTGYAYETISNKGIIAGRTKGPDVITVQPATLDRLARGSAGPAAWRHKESTGTH